MLSLCEKDQLLHLNTQFSLFDLLIIIGIIQGIITGILLLTSKKNVRSNKFLAFGLFSFCFLSTKTLLHTLHLWDTILFRFFPNALELAIPPLIYFYAVSLVNPKFKFKTKNWIHFLPFLIAQSYAFIVYFTALQTNVFAEKDAIALSLGFDTVKLAEEYLLLIYLVFYILSGYKELRNYKKWLDNTTSDGTFPDFRWLMNIFRLSLIIGAFLLVNHSLDIFFNFKSITMLHWNSLILFFTFLIYFLGLKGYLQPDYSFSKEEIDLDNARQASLPSIKITETIEELEKVMELEKAFLNPKLSIHELSHELGISQKRLSVAINEHYGMNFRDFINKYRIDEVKSKLNSDEYKHMSILGIALECGFNSEASFYRIFKKNTGTSPKDYIQNSNNLSSG